MRRGGVRAGARGGNGGKAAGVPWPRGGGGRATPTPPLLGTGRQAPVATGNCRRSASCARARRRGRSAGAPPHRRNAPDHRLQVLAAASGEEGIALRQLKSRGGTAPQ